MRYRDPRFSPFNAPTRKGLHPHSGYISVKDGRDQEGYEDEGEAAKQLGAASPNQSKGILDWAFEHPILSLGGLVAMIMAINSVAGGKKTPRVNPADADEIETGDISQIQLPARAPQQTNVTINISGLNGAQPKIGAAPSSAPVQLEVKQEVTAPEPKQLEAPKADETVVVEVKEEKPPKPRQRITTQARDENGKYLPAGTAKKHKEGT